MDKDYPQQIKDILDSPHYQALDFGDEKWAKRHFIEYATKAIRDGADVYMEKDGLSVSVSYSGMKTERDGNARMFMPRITHSIPNAQLTNGSFDTGLVERLYTEASECVNEWLTKQAGWVSLHRGPH